MTDETGPYADSGGSGSVLAAQMAAADFGGSVLGQPIEIVHGDTQNKPDVAASLARQWYDFGVDAIVDLPVTPVASAVQQIAKEKIGTVTIDRCGGERVYLEDVLSRQHALGGRYPRS